jgi:16S rRNA (guanine966-N2)-methyltransferase
MKRVSRPTRATSTTKNKNTRNNVNKTGQIRIIGGQFRGRKLPVLNVQGLRPTTDRNKETLFNWLMHHITDAHCLDVFAGSGGLGLEALSRYAKSCDFIELDKAASQQLKTNIIRLADALDTHVYNSDALTTLAQLKNSQYDVVFVDPPFNQGLLSPTLEALQQYDLVKSGGVIYIEHEVQLAAPPLPSNWQIIKEKHTSALRYFLVQVN